MDVLAIIPARGGSKGIPGKNIYAIDGIPLIHYTIDAAIKSDCLKWIVVTSDDDRILKVSKSDGVVLIKRPTELAADSTSIIPVIEHALGCIEKENAAMPDAIMLLQPTSPIREVFHIRDAVEKLKNSSVAKSLISVCEMHDMHPARMYSIKDECLVPLMPEMEQVRRQDIEPVYYRNGSIYLVRTPAFFEHRSVMVKPAIPFVMDDKYLANIDEPRDLIIAEALIKAWRGNQL